MRLPRLHVRLLTRFYLVSFLVVVTLVTGMATGFGLFYRLFYVLALVSVFSYLWDWLTLRSLEVNLGRRTRQAKVGDTIEETITVRNLSRLPKHPLEVENLTDLPGYSGGVVISVRGNRSSSWTTRTPARKRGVYSLGPMRVATADPFGLFRRDRLFGETESLTVFPRTFDLSGFAVPAADLSGESSTRGRTHSVTPHASSIRDYAFGDSLSRVHWNSTARLGRLMSKEFDLGRAGEVWMLVDLHRDVQAGELEESSDEYAVTIAASLVKRYLEAQQPAGLIAYGDQRYHIPAETGTGQFNRIMLYLAMGKAEGDTPLEVVVPKEEPAWSPHSSLVVITPSPRLEWVVALRELAKRGVRVAVVLVDGESFGGFFKTLDVLDHLYLAGLQTYVVKKGDDIPGALSHPYTVSGTVAPEQLQEVSASA